MQSRWVPALLAAVMLASCAGGEEPTFTEQANTACEQIGRRLEALPRPTTKPEFDAFLDRTAEVNRDGVAKLRALAPPEDLRDDHDELVKAGSDAAAEFERYARAYKQENSQRQDAALQALNEARARYQTVARRLGLTRCLIETPSPSPSPS